MKLEQVAIQLYTLRELCKDEESLHNTLKKVKEIGYQAIQVSGIGPIDPATVARLAKEHGLVICATHEPGVEIINNPEKVVEKLNILGCDYTAYPHPSYDLSSSVQVAEMIAGLERSTQVLRNAGKKLCYHNHHIEFRKIDGEVILKKIYNESSIYGELDTYWIQFGGGSNEEYCKMLRGRLPLLHLKDYKINNENKVTYCEIGAGTLDFKSIIREAELSGCEWFIVEQDQCPGDPFDSIQQSFDYIKANLLD